MQFVIHLHAYCPQGIYQAGQKLPGIIDTKHLREWLFHSQTGVGAEVGN
jgi:hypothetical protein